MGKTDTAWTKAMGPFFPQCEWAEMETGDRHGWPIGRHSNARFELHVILEGSCCIEVDDRKHTLKTGQGILLAPHVFHAPSAVSSDFYRFTTPFRADKEFLRAAGILNIGSHVIFDYDRDLQEVCRRILQEIDEKNGFLREEMLTVLFTQLMIQTFRLARQGEFYMPYKHHTPLVEEVLIIDKFFASADYEKRTKKELARQLHCSERQVVRKMYAMYGVSFQQKMIETRIDHAQYLLRDTQMSINDIAAAVGYADNAAFFRAFRQWVKMTPKEYRRQQKAADGKLR